jgi:hypothetical protein
MKILSLLGALVALAGQTIGAPIAGSWTAQFEGRTFVRLELKATNGTLAGGISLGNIEVDKEGAPKSVGEAPRDLTPIFEVTQTASTVRFARKDGNDTDRFELRVLESGRAELQFLLTDRDRRHLEATGVPALKPFQLTRQ